ncbi:MAG: prepilin-type N-terminal cleavage/methylation domain-containing protein [Planctomycetota bacterium]
MIHTSFKNAFTLTELLAVFAVVALLATIAVPAIHATSQARGQVVCLANLREIGRASLFYATDDAREQIVPLHRMAVSTLIGTGFGGTEWSWRTALPSAYGGRTPVTPFPTESGVVTIMLDENGYWGTPTRPLNSYISGDLGLGDDLDVFHCPADSGYPDAEWVWDAPQEAAGIPCWDFLGNSYRINTLGVTWLSGSLRTGALPSGPWGHWASSLASPLAETVLYCEPLFFNWAYVAAWGEQLPPVPGWHGEILSDHVAYCDGSARMTEMGELYEFSDEELYEMGYTTAFPGRYFLRRGPTWQMDCYPTPGALIRVFAPNGQPMTPSFPYTGWPFDNYQYNLPPE